MVLKLFRNLLLVMGFGVIAFNSGAQLLQKASSELKAGSPLIDDRGAPAGYINRQADSTLRVVGTILGKYPPQFPEPPERRLALFALDGVLYNDIDSPKRPAVQSFFHSQFRKAVQRIQNTHISQEVMISKLYDHGFIIKTAATTLGFDLIRGDCVSAEGFSVENSEMERLINACDVLFISHHHADHVDEWVVRQFISSGKPVIIPPDLWADSPIRKNLIVLERDPGKITELPVQQGRAIIKVAVLPGHQNENVINNLYWVSTPEGVAVCHTGDQHNREDLKWIANIADRYAVDVLMVNCWARNIVELIDGFNPKLVVTGHEHELGHGLDHRKPYWLTFQRLEKCSVPALVMAWGESFFFLPEPK